ncbi:hypothetical protein KGF56_003949 [Candida oxycetoniae]|uniref:Uncharacterized protein n=1 Tax=Candida oxycetoniae TaxID=497107 RepID=A0AAI9SUG1_9ASCO|nr:uncharacterized protein KGF56_003949 [Candida oxycetoniae]KAI3403243.1 hypothetical protein KGF56_003949 [Candida oxycetoniae]
MRLSSVIAASAALLSSAVAKDVACLVGGQLVGIVDLDTGLCPFTITSEVEKPVFEFTSTSDFNVLFYYSTVDGVHKYFTDIINAGNVIDIPAKFLYGDTPNAPLYQVKVEEHPASNSTEAIRKRLMKQRGLDVSAVSNVKRESVEDFVEALKQIEGTFIDTSIFEVVDHVPSSAEQTIVSTTISTVTDCTSSATDGVAGIVTEKATTVVTVTSCEEDICHETTVDATASVATATVGGVTTVYTTYCPVSSIETPQSTKTVTITSCENDACYTSAVVATPAWTTETIQGTVTEYITYCPVSEESSKASATETEKEQVSSVATPVGITVVTSGSTVITSTVYQTVVISLGGALPTSLATESAQQTVAAESQVAQQTVAAQSESASTNPASTVSAYEGSAATNGATFLALALIPLAYFM